MSHIDIVVQEQRRPEVLHKVRVHGVNTILDVKRKLESIVGFPRDRLRILLASTMQLLPNSQVLSKLMPFGEPALVVTYGFSPCEYSLEPGKGISMNAKAREMVFLVQQGLNQTKNAPGKTDSWDCTGGVYFLKGSSGNIVGVFKPQDEEQGMVNNPKGYAGNGTHGLRPHFRPGEGYLREYAAYRMDVDNFAKIPVTTVVSCEHSIFNYSKDKDKDNKPITFPKLGSLQRYVRASDTYDDVSPSMLSDFEVQKIALLDMRILNSDRNGANILVVRKEQPTSDRRGSRGESLSSVGELNETELDMLDFLGGSSGFRESSRGNDLYELIPIDHGYSLPTKLHIEEIDWVWFYAPQVARPVHPDIKAYLNKIDFESLISSITSEVKLSEDTIFLLRTVHELLVTGVNAGLTLYELATLIARVDFDVPSPLEKMINRAEDNAFSTIEIREGNRFAKVGAGSESESPVRRGKNPSTPVGTPPRAEFEFLRQKFVQSELSKASCEDVRPNQPSQEEIRRQILFSPSFSLQGQPLREMRTLDSSGISLLMKSSASVPPAMIPVSTAASSIDASPLDRKSDMVFRDSYEGVTASEGSSSLESASESPRHLFDFPYFRSNGMVGMATVPGDYGSAPTTFSDRDGIRSGSNSFEALEVQTSQPLVFEKSSATSRNVSGTDDGYDSYADIEQDSTCDNSIASTPTESMFEMLMQSYGGHFPLVNDKFKPTVRPSGFSTDNLEAIPMARVSSYSALESPPLYTVENDNKPHRLMRHLRREKRKQAATSADFPGLRREYTERGLKKLVANAIAGLV